jgi:hypothetical protein
LSWVERLALARRLRAVVHFLGAAYVTVLVALLLMLAVVMPLVVIAFWLGL